MATKESSNESSAALSAPVVVKADDKRTAKDYLALVVATCGVGYMPIAPGTWGSLVGVALYLSLNFTVPRLLLRNPTFKAVMILPIETPLLAFMLAVIFIVTAVGIWAASRAEKLFKEKDPGAVVIDEVAGQMIALLSVPYIFPGWLPIITAFLLFRAFDIWKPYPIRRLEMLESGLGIMMDDVVAGLYAAIVNSIFITGLLIFLSRG